MLTNEEYHADFSAISNSMLGTFLDSPKVYYHRYIRRTIPAKPSTASMQLGTAVHTLVLEPELFEREVIEIPSWALSRGCRRGNTWKAFLKENPSQILLNRAEMKRVREMASCVLEEAGPWMRAAGQVEPSIYWTDADTGLRLKCRTDKLIVMDAGALIVDLKTSYNATAKSFAESFQRFRYGMQEVHYIDGVQALTGLDAEFRFVVVQSKPQHFAKKYKTSPEERETARRARRRALSQLAEKYETWDKERR